MLIDLAQLAFSLDLTVVASLGPFALLSPTSIFTCSLDVVAPSYMGVHFSGSKSDVGSRNLGCKQKTPGLRNDVWVREMVSDSFLMQRVHAHDNPSYPPAYAKTFHVWLSGLGEATVASGSSGG